MNKLVRPFDCVLIANRGEIARRVIRSARQLGLRTIAVYSDADRHAPYVTDADDAIHIGSAPARESYLNVERLIDAARKSGAQAIHPGYGFLSENAAFATAVETGGLVFVGPSAQAIDAMGNKARAKDLMERAGVPTVPGFRDAGADDAAFIAAASAIGYPVMVKAAAGGGGRGMRIVHDAAQLAAALPTARSEALGAFGSGELLLERAVQRARHIEIQILADTHGNVVHLGERDCSVQRRHQKVIEETPSTAVNAALRADMTASAVAAARAIGYIGAGTLEYLLAPDGAFYFMEMNTRLQVEHPVTEMVTGLDLVEWQLRIAAGEPLGFTQDEVHFRGHAIEVRLCAETPEDGFLPQSGPVLAWRAPAPERQVRTDHSLRSGGAIASFYDSMVAKLVAHGATRREAIRKLARGLEDCVLLGTRTNQSFLLDCLSHERFVAGDIHTGFIAEHFAQGIHAADLPDEALALIAAWRGGGLGAAALIGRAAARPVEFSCAGQAIAALVEPALPGCTVRLASDGPALAVCDIAHTEGTLSGEIGGRRITLAIIQEGFALHVAWRGRSAVLTLADPLARKPAASGDGTLTAPLAGRVVAVNAAPGTTVKAGDIIVTLEAMKMEHSLAAPFDGTLENAGVKPGDQVRPGQMLARVVRTGQTQDNEESA
ncbi:MAG: biotin/lipoyl-binding protein [Burkholderiaceae bacterium]|jgi:geranyl-CoA carboxylase alpha subunit|nr:biotin/lipoyl-binding protein [Burkholderiaceae bacterium]